MSDERTGARPADAPKLGAARTVASTFGAVVRPIQEFFRLEAASGILLFAGAVAALVWSNSPAHDSYHRVFETPLSLQIGALTARASLHQVINEGLMAVFFFLVGMEIKRELVGGELRTLKRALLPAVAAVGGMVVPSAIFLAFNWNGPGRAGWGIPIATDIAFCIGCLTLLGRRVPASLIVFLTALAIFDDIGGILVIAVFYGDGVQPRWLLAAVGVMLVLYVMNSAYVRKGPAYAIVGGALWYALHRGGVHATVAGVVLGLMIPARPRRRPRAVLRELGDHVRGLIARPTNEDLDGAAILQIEEKLEDLEAPLTRFVHLLHPLVAFGIVPLFAVANSGVSLGGKAATEVGGVVALGTALGLLVGKPLGIMAASFLAVRSGIAERPQNVGWTRLFGVSIIAGIGFTVALFIAGLAYPDALPLLDQAKIGILLGSAAAGLAGMLLLRAISPSAAAEPERLEAEANGPALDQAQLVSAAGGGDARALAGAASSAPVPAQGHDHQPDGDGGVVGEGRERATWQQERRGAEPGGQRNADVAGGAPAARSDDP